MRLYVNAVVCLCADFFLMNYLNLKSSLLCLYGETENKQPNWERPFLELGEFLAYYASTYPVA